MTKETYKTKTTKENYQDAITELLGAPKSELQAIINNAAYHTWYRQAAQDVLNERS